MLPGRQLTVLDGAFFAHRSWHARSGRPIEAFVRQITRLIGNEGPDLMAAAWDAPGPNFRHELYAAYKANREEKEPELERHIERCADALRALGVPVFEAVGYEGDDVVATLTERWHGGGGVVRVHTADKDLLQLVRPGVTIVLRGEDYGRDEVVDRWGVPPELIADLLALAGDAVDGIPGVPGIGALTAARLLAQWGSVEGVFEQLHHVTESRRNALRDHRDAVELYRRLTRLAADAPVPLHAPDLLFIPNVEEFMAFCRDHDIWPEPLTHHYRERLLVWQERLAIMAEAGVHDETARGAAQHECLQLLPGC